MVSIRTPTAEMRRRLRKEVNYGCPFCRSPFLTWHHFDPPWEPLHVHNEAGMIALCSECHRFADGGHFTKQQLRQAKFTPSSDPPKGRLPWNPSDAFIIFGGNCFVTRKGKLFSFRITGINVFSLRLTDNSYLAINALIWDKLNNLVCGIEDNDIVPILGSIGDLECKAQAKEISIFSKTNDASIELKFDRFTIKELLSVTSKDMRHQGVASARVLVMQHIEDLAHSVVDSDHLIPTITIKMDIHGPGFEVRTDNKGIHLDMRQLGYDTAILTGKVVGEYCININYSNVEIIHVGSEERQ